MHARTPVAPGVVGRSKAYFAHFHEKKKKKDARILYTRANKAKVQQLVAFIAEDYT